MRTSERMHIAIALYIAFAQLSVGATFRRRILNIKIKLKLKKTHFQHFFLPLVVSKTHIIYNSFLQFTIHYYYNYQSCLLSAQM